MNPFPLLVFVLSVYGFTQTPDYTISNLDSNTEYPHFGLMETPKGKILYISYAINKRGKVESVGGHPVLTLYEGVVNPGGNITAVSPVAIDPEANLSVITSAAVSPDGQHLIITTQYTHKTKPQGDFKDTNFHLEIGAYKEGLGWTNFKVLPFCEPRYSYGHPAFSNDGKTLFFIANLRGGKETTKGGSDIFKVDIVDHNTYSAPANMGSNINSYSREMFPVVGPDNTLYFASNRPGYGGFDMYKSKMNEHGTYEKAEKLPKPLNSDKDDFSLIMNADNRSGFFVSKRDGGKGDDDIYYFAKP
ncbi:TolB family protein [Aestuariivivens sediminis]|uniref:TolB family protein n=1 Tax=Aestuariivivens sediminis TaxID=2913557 RepID=UPI001F59FE65|nr:hypothetical protein [Aestuariivivens sediminis]